MDWGQTKPTIQIMVHRFLWRLRQRLLYDLFRPGEQRHRRQRELYWRRILWQLQQIPWHVLRLNPVSDSKTPFLQTNYGKTNDYIYVDIFSSFPFLLNYPFVLISMKTNNIIYYQISYPFSCFSC